MTAISEDVIRSLAAVRSEQGVTSCYLDVDGRRHVREVDYERVFDSMVRRHRDQAAHDCSDADLARIEALVRNGFDRSRVRGVAVFSSVAEDLWQVVELPVPVRSQLVVNSAPAVGQLETVVQQTATIGALLADKTHARVYVYHLDQLVEHTEVIDEIGRDYDTVGEHDRGGVEDHREELEHQHLRHAARLLWSAFQTHGFDHVVLAVPEHLAGELEADLHPYLRERLRGPLGVEPSASESAVRTAIMQMAADIEHERETEIVESLRAAVGADRRAVAGLDAALDALAEQRVETLVVSAGYEAEGWRCPGCGRLATVGRQCVCGDEMRHVDDVVEHAVDDALAGRSVVEMCSGNADLDVLGRIGAHLRY
ncbi:MAG: hypothetical protein U5K30_01275 [Acidimicrobiales bacterium]|nr:hypothetical protein [Acidimicrobiales bacterium]